MPYFTFLETGLQARKCIIVYICFVMFSFFLQSLWLELETPLLTGAYL